MNQQLSFDSNCVAPIYPIDLWRLSKADLREEDQPMRQVTHDSQIHPFHFHYNSIEFNPHSVKIIHQVKNGVQQTHTKTDKPNDSEEEK